MSVLVFTVTWPVSDPPPFLGFSSYCSDRVRGRVHMEPRGNQCEPLLPLVHEIREEGS